MLQFPIPRPRSSEGTILPAALAAALAGMLALQLMLVRTDDAEPAEPAGTGWVAGEQASRLPTIGPLAADAAITSNPIFAPSRSGNGEASASPLGGAQVSGAWGVGRQMNLVLRQPDGTTRTLRPGQSINDWVLAAVTPEGARFSSGGKIIEVPFGSSAPAKAAEPKDTKEEQGQ